MRKKILTPLLTACAWTVLLVLVVAGIARASIEAKEKRIENAVRTAKVQGARRG